jgi:hypothetical protein
MAGFDGRLSLFRMAAKLAANNRKSAKATTPAAASRTKAPAYDDDEFDDRDEAAARGRERGRIKAILLSTSVGAHNYESALKLAFDTRMTRGEAVAVLSGMKPTAAEQPRQDATAAAIIQAGKKARGELDHDTASMPSGLAGEIIRAGQRRRGETT